MELDKTAKNDFDPMMLAIDSFKFEDDDISIDKNIKLLENMYRENENRDQFNGKKQSKIDIEERAKVFIDMIHKIK